MGKVVATVAMVAVVVAVAYFAPQISAALLTAMGTTTATALATTAMTALVATALTAAAALGMQMAGLMPRIGTPTSRGGVPGMFRQSISESFVVYGKRRVGGLLVFFHPSKVGKEYFRYFVIAVAGHRCRGNPTWMLNDETVTVDGSGMVTSGKYSGAAWLWFQRGLATETANATFVAECGGKWTASHRGDDTAAIYAKFHLTDDVVAAGMPNISAIIEGKDDIADPRNDSTGYTNNAALVFYDWMRTPRELGGFGAYDDEIPDDDWISAQANVCDEDVLGQPRYALDGIIVTGAAPSDIRDMLVLNCAGSFTYSGGKFLMRPGYYVPVTQTFDEKDLAGPITVNPFVPGDSTANRVEGTFIDPGNKYTGMPFAAQQIVGATDVRQMDLDLAFITNRYRAECVASIMLKRAAAEKTVQWPMNIMGLKTQALDTIQLTASRYGLNNYAWTVGAWGMSADYSVVLSLREESPEIYDLPAVVAVGEVSTIDPVTSPRDDVEAPAPGAWALEATILSGDGTSFPALLITGAVDDPNADGIVFEYYPGGAPPADEDDWITTAISPPNATRREITGVMSGTSYMAAVSYQVGTVIGERLVLGPVSTGLSGAGGRLTLESSGRILLENGSQLLLEA